MLLLLRTYISYWFPMWSYRSFWSCLGLNDPSDPVFGSHWSCFHLHDPTNPSGLILIYLILLAEREPWTEYTQETLNPQVQKDNPGPSTRIWTWNISTNRARTNCRKRPLGQDQKRTLDTYLDIEISGLHKWQACLVRERAGQQTQFRQEHHMPVPSTYWQK